MAGYRTSQLRAVCRRVHDRTILADRYHETPIKITKTFQQDNGALSMILMDVSPGLMDGDRYIITMRLEEAAHVQLTTQSYTKVHPTPHLPAITDYTFELDQGAILEYFPEPTIPYASSTLIAHNRFNLADRAVLIFAEITTPGRTHRGELFQFDALTSFTEVYRNNQLIGWDRFQLEPALHNYEALGAFENYTHMGSFWIFADFAGEALLARIREALPSPDSPDEPLAGASLTADHGIAVRMLGTRVWQLEQLRDRLSALCQDLLPAIP